MKIPFLFTKTYVKGTLPVNTGQWVGLEPKTFRSGPRFTRLLSF